MKNSQESYLDLVNNAYNGKLKLPAFQRKWRWQAPSVCALYDSLRKQFPIGSFLLIEGNNAETFNPRDFQGSITNIKTTERLVLDGQQRITAGITLFKEQIGHGRYFLDISKIYNVFQSHNIIYGDESFTNAVSIFCQELDEEDDYVIKTTARTNNEEFLSEKRWISTHYLADRSSAQMFIEQHHPNYQSDEDFKKFIDHVFLNNFIIKEYQVPVVTLNDDESLAAITKVFTTINMTGKKLTSVEIVVAVLFTGNVELEKEFDEYKDISSYLATIDPTSVLLLQTVCLLDGVISKKALLPKMINHDNFNTHSRDAVTLIDLACNFLSNNLGFGLSKTDKLIPHPTTVVTLAIVWKFLKDSEKENESDVKRHLEKWIIHSTLSKRYTEGSQTKMEKDARELVKYFKELFRGNNPDYPECFKFEGLTSDILYTIPSSAQGRLVRSFFNLQKPRDPLKFDNRVYYDESYSEPQEHHIWPKKFLKGIPGWTEDKEANNVLNIMFVTAETNKEFDSLNPADQLQLIEQKVPEEARRQEIFKANFLSPRCIELMKKPNKNREDYIDFLNARHEIIVDYLNNYFGIENSNN